jgi:hypothetical protein
MMPSDKCRDSLVAARLALFEADLALAMDDPRRVVVQLDLAQAYIAETHKTLPPAQQPSKPCTS